MHDLGQISIVSAQHQDAPGTPTGYMVYIVSCLRAGDLSVNFGDTSPSAPPVHSEAAAAGGSTSVAAPYRASSLDRTDLPAQFR